MPRTTTIARFFNLSVSQINRKIKAGVRYDYMYRVLTEPSLTEVEKRRYIMGTSMPTHLKENVWARYTGEKPRRAS